MKTIKKFLLLLLTGSSVLFISCDPKDIDDPDPDPEDSIEEVVEDEIFVPEMLPSVYSLYDVNFSADAHPSNQGTAFTSVATSETEDIYTTFVDADRSMKIVKIFPNGLKEEKVIRTFVQNNPFHVKASVAIDKNGYIHVCGNTHNQPWEYYISDQPNSIQSFTKISAIPGEEVTYPQFFKDKNNELYITFRHKVKPAPDNWTKGSSGGGIIKYDATAKTFTMLGGTDHKFAKTVVWSNHGGQDGHYQQPGIRLFFDNNNRMHLIATMIGEDGHPTAAWKCTHLMYAYSDDGGTSFYTIDKKKIASLPMTPATATIVSYSGDCDIWDNAYIGAFKSDRPVVGWRNDAGYKLMKWTGKRWTSILPEENASGILYMRRNGEMAMLRSYQGIYISRDWGKTFKKYWFNPAIGPSGPTDEIIDWNYYIATGMFRFQYMSNSATKVHVVTLNPN